MKARQMLAWMLLIIPATAVAVALIIFLTNRPLPIAVVGDLTILDSEVDDGDFSIIHGTVSLMVINTTRDPLPVNLEKYEAFTAIVDKDEWGLSSDLTKQVHDIGLLHLSPREVRHFKLPMNSSFKGKGLQVFFLETSNIRD